MAESYDKDCLKLRLQPEAKTIKQDINSDEEKEQKQQNKEIAKEEKKEEKREEIKPKKKVGRYIYTLDLINVIARIALKVKSSYF